MLQFQSKQPNNQAIGHNRNSEREPIRLTIQGSFLQPNTMGFQTKMTYLGLNTKNKKRTAPSYMMMTFPSNKNKRRVPNAHRDKIRIRMTSDYQQLEVIRPQRNGSKVAGANIHSCQLSLKCEHEMKTISVMQNFEKLTSHEPCLRKLLKEISTNTGNKLSKKKRWGMKLRKQGSNPRERQMKCPR